MAYLLRRSNTVLAATVLVACAALLALRSVEGLWPPLAWWSFVLLSLTLGFGHGALDAVLLMAQFRPMSKALYASALYLACVLVTAAVLAQSVGVALLALLLMSVWHFGEMHSQHAIRRICVGGASVMWPVLVAHQALAQVLQALLGTSFEWVWLVWRALAWGWLALTLLAGLWAARQWWVQSSEPQYGWSALEVLAVLALYLALSPLLAFALYHCIAHVARIHRAVVAHPGVARGPYSLAVAGSVVATALLMALLWVYMPQWVGPGVLGSAQVLQWIVVALAAVTLPHLVLVSYSARWMGR
jgi:Brp/Blh family beta-carotene 15,15'-monooxygenase